ncbi:O-antigen ligase family protein [Geodermatophilus sp. SYSU D00691]
MACTFLLVLTTVGWRRGEYFSGSLDPVVLAKGLLSVTALALAFLMAQKARRLGLGTGSLWVLAVVLATSALGALTHGVAFAGGVVAVRAAILAVTVVLLLRAFPSAQVFTALTWCCAALGAVAATTGISTLGGGRLSGGVPEIDPNELALLASFVVLHAAWRLVLGGVGPVDLAAATVASGVIWATGSRTALLMLVAAIVVVLLHVRRPPVALVVGGLVLAAVGCLLAATDPGVLTGFLERDGAGTSTLESRFIAWDAATTWADDAWQLVFGGGLSVKIIPVAGQWWDTQPLDSSWVSLLVQTGVLGLLVCGAWALWALRGAFLAPREHRALFLGLLVFLLGRSVLESGLFDATPAFLGFVAVSLLAEGGSRRRLGDELRPAAVAPSARPAPVDTVPHAG